MDNLVTQDELENECPKYMDDLHEFINSHTYMADKVEATCYVLAQVLHEKLEQLDLELEDKGAVVATLIRGFVEFNGPALAAHRELQKIIFEQKASTTH